MTLAGLLALDAATMWASLTHEQQMAIVVPLLTCACAEVVQDDDGTDASWQDRETAAGMVQSRYQDMWNALKIAFIDILGDDITALHTGPTADMMDGFGKVAVKGLRGRRTLYGIDRGTFIRRGGGKVEIVGWKNLGTEDAPIWEGWLQHHVDAERLRRHPDQFVGPRLPAPALLFQPVVPALARPHTDHYFGDDDGDYYFDAA